MMMKLAHLATMHDCGSTGTVRAHAQDIESVRVACMSRPARMLTWHFRTMYLCFVLSVKPLIY